MGRVDRFERRLQAAVGNGFARVFGGKVVPQEVAMELEREAESNIEHLAGGHLLAPNAFRVQLGPADHDRLAGEKDHEAHVCAELATYLAEHLAERGYQTYGDVVVSLERSETLHTGQFRTESSVDPDAAARVKRAEPSRQAEDRSMSQPPGQYHGDPYGGQHPGYDPYGQQGQYGYDPYGGQQQPGYDPYGGQQQPGYDPYGQQQGGYDPYGQPPAGYDQGYGQPGQPPGGYDPYSGGNPQQPAYDPYGQPPAGYDQGYGQQPPASGFDPYSGGNPQQPPYDPYGQPPAGYDQGYGQQPPASGFDQGYAQPPSNPMPAQQPYGTPPGGQPGMDPNQGYGAPMAPGHPQQQPPPAQPPTGRPMQAVIQLTDGTHRSHTLRQGSNVVGRGQDADFRLPDTGVSRRHLEINWNGHSATLDDLNSTNGTTVNDTPVQQGWQLQDGDVIRIGHSSMVFHVQG